MFRKMSFLFVGAILSFILLPLEISQAQVVVKAIRQLTTESVRQSNPTWSPTDSLAYEQDPGDIWVMNAADGSGKHPLVMYPAWDVHPSWSPDGNKIAFTSNRSVWPGDVWVKDLGDSSETRLTYVGTQNYVHSSQAWSPDGSKIVFGTNRNSGSIDVNLDTYVMNSDGSNQDSLATGNTGSAAWSPIGDKIAFTRAPIDSHNYDLWVMNANGSDQHMIVPNALCRSWSPDGSIIAFTRDGDIWVTTVDGIHITRLTTDPAADASPAWSPDGQKIAFSSGRSGNEDIWVLDIVRRGDVNGDNVVEIGDVVYLINYLYKGGPAPDPLAAGDCNCDGTVDVGDVVCLINYLYKGGSAPDCGGTSNPPSGGSSGNSQSLRKTATSAQVGLMASESSEEGNFMQVVASSGSDLLGVELDLSFNPQKIQSIVPELADRAKDMTLFFSAKDGILKVGILDLTGQNVIPTGEGALVKLAIVGSDLSSLQLQRAILVDVQATVFEGTILAKQEQATAPEDFVLSQNYPNPFNLSTKIEFGLKHSGFVSLNIYDILGRKVRTLVSQNSSSGHKSVLWDGKDNNGREVASGVYFYKIQAGDFAESKRMLLLK